MLRLTLTVFILCVSVFFSNPSIGQVRIPGSNFGSFSPGTKIAINQVETINFPKVKLFTSVTRGGMPLGGLTVKNFKVKENNIDQASVKVLVERDAISVVILLDVGESMKTSIKDPKLTATTFLKTLQKRDRVQVMAFNEQINTIYPFGNDFKTAEKAIRSVQYRGESALYDGVYAAIKALRDIPGRRAVVILSDGIDDDGSGQQLSERDFDAPLMLGIQTNVPLYTIGHASKMDSGILKTFAGTTGAEYASAPNKIELKSLYSRIGQQLSSQYAIEYTTTNAMEGGLREVEVDFVTPGGKPFALSDPLVKETRQVVSYEVPNLGKFVPKKPMKWPEEVPFYRNAGEIKISYQKDLDSFTFNAPENTEAFIKNYRHILVEENWSVHSESKTSSRAFIKVSKGRSEMTVAIKGIQGKSEVKIEYRIPPSEPIVVEKNSLNQIIAADGRDVNVTGKDGVIIISGGCGKLTLSSGGNQVQCDVVREVEVIGNNNVLIFGSLGKGIISGGKNELSWGSGLHGDKPDVKITGSENKVMRLE